MAVVRLAADLRRAKRDQVPGGVEDLGHGAVARGQVADGIGEDSGHVSLLGQLRHPGRAVRAAGRVEMVHDLDGDLHAEVPPVVQGAAGEVRAAGRDRLPDIAGRAEQEDEPHGVLGDEAGRHGRGDTVICGFTICGFTVSSGDEAAERRPALAALGQQRDAPRRIAERQVSAEDGLQAGLGTRLGVPERAVQPIPVGKRQRGHAELPPRGQPALTGSPCHSAASTTTRRAGG